MKWICSRALKDTLEKSEILKSLVLLNTALQMFTLCPTFIL